MRRTRLCGKKGVTLIELIIAAGICAIVLAAAVTVFTTGVKTYNVNLGSTVDQQGLRSAMLSVSRQARSPANTVTVTGTKVLTVNGKNYTVSGGNLVYNGAIVAKNISAINADYTDASHKVIQVDLTSKGGNTLSTQITVN